MVHYRKVPGIYFVVGGGGGGIDYKIGVYLRQDFSNFFSLHLTALGLWRCNINECINIIIYQNYSDPTHF